MEQITENVALFESLKSANRGTIVTIAYKSEPKMNKRGNPLYGRVEKMSIAQYQFAPNYANCVNNALVRNEREGDFVAEEPKGFYHLEGFGGRFVCSKKTNEIHGVFKVLKSSAKVQVSYFVDGREASGEEIEIIKEFSPKGSFSVKQASYGLEEGEQILWRYLNLNKIVDIKGI